MDFTKDIYINKEKICEDSEFVLLYKGELFSKDLKKEVYMSYGYGDNWDNKSEIQMKPSTFGYLATVNVNSGNELQFVFRDNEGHWDNNNSENFKIPICENEEVLSFNPVIESAKEVDVEVISETDNNENDFDLVFEPEIIEVNEVDLYKTVEIEDTDKQAIPNNTVYTKVNLDKSEVVNNVVQAPIKEEKVDVGFAEVAKEAKEKSAVAFEEGTISTGSVYVNSIVKDTPKKVDNLVKEKALVEVPENSLTKPTSLFGSLFAGVKTAFAKVVKLIKTAFDFENDEN